MARSTVTPAAAAYALDVQFDYIEPELAWEQRQVVRRTAGGRSR